MAIDFNKLLRQAKQEAREKKASSANASSAKPTVVRQVSNGIRCCSTEECEEWIGNRQLQRQGAGFELDGPAQRAQLIASIGMGRALGSTRVMLLRNTPAGMAETYNFRGSPTLPKINAIANGQSTMVSWLDLAENTNEEAADLVLAVLQNAEIMNT